MALARRDELYNGLNRIPPKALARRIVFRDSRNSTGVLGVCRISKTSSNGTVNESYSVSWRPSPGVQKCTSFSIRKYGEEKAFQLAVEHRKRMLEEIHGEKIVRKMKIGKKPKSAS